MCVETVHVRALLVLLAVSSAAPPGDPLLVRLPLKQALTSPSCLSVSFTERHCCR